MFRLHDLKTVLSRTLHDLTPSNLAIDVYGTYMAMIPLLWRWRLQLTQGNFVHNSWFIGAQSLLRSTLSRSHERYHVALEDMPSAMERQVIEDNLQTIAEDLGLDNADILEALSPDIPLLLMPFHDRCETCRADRGNGNPIVLKLYRGIRAVTVITKSYEKKIGYMAIGICSNCKARYYPDRTIQRMEDALRHCFIYNAEFLHISKPAKLWVHRSIAIAQAQNIMQHQTFSGYASWFNKTYGPYGFVQDLAANPDQAASRPTLTNDQSYRLFVEHMVRCLGQAIPTPEPFHVNHNPTTEDIVREANVLFAIQKGVLPGALNHTCPKCTHNRQPPPHHVPQQDADQVAMDVNAARAAVAMDIAASADDEGEDSEDEDLDVPMDEPQVVRLLVVDGKVTGHALCNAPAEAFDNPQDFPCRNPPTDFKSARFCLDHAHLNNVCGIDGCDQPVVRPSKVCDDQAHQEFWNHYQTRFARTSVQAVRRTQERRDEVRQQAAAGNPVQALPDPPPLPQLVEGQDVRHRFRATRSYCIQIGTWACGFPAAVTKMYHSESETQVYQMLNSVWPDNLNDLRPDYIAYDRACFLLAHIVHQHPNSPWINRTRFVVDAWHWISHSPEDALCRSYCNPAPTDGSQPDLVIEEEDNDGVIRRKRAFNTEVAEQLNAWINGFKGALNRMTDYNFDFFIFCLLFLKAEDWKFQRSAEGRRLDAAQAVRADDEEDNDDYDDDDDDNEDDDDGNAN